MVEEGREGVRQMFQVPINYFAVIIAGIASMIVGFIWYGPLFGEEWKKMAGMSKEKMEKAKKEEMQKTYILTFLLTLVMAYVLDHFIWFSAPGSVTPVIGIKTALWAWVGFLFPLMVTNHLFAADKKPLKLLLIGGSHELVSLAVMGAILGMLR